MKPFLSQDNVEVINLKLSQQLVRSDSSHILWLYITDLSDHGSSILFISLPIGSLFKLAIMTLLTIKKNSLYIL